MNKPSNPFADLESLRREAEVVELHTVNVVAKWAKRAARNVDHVGFPLAFLAAVYHRTRGRTVLVVAQLIYRRTFVCRSTTVTMPGAELARLGISRSTQRKALLQLVSGGLIRIERIAAGRPTLVTLLWTPPEPDRGE